MQKTTAFAPQHTIMKDQAYNYFWSTHGGCVIIDRNKTLLKKKIYDYHAL